MTYTTVAPYNTDPNFIVNGSRTYSRLFRIDDNAVVADGANISAYDDEGQVFTARKYADDSGLGLGELITYHVYDNGDGTMNVYYQVGDADPLPKVYTNWVVKLDIETGAEVAAPVQITSGAFSRTDQSMLDFSYNLPDGRIALIKTTSSMAAAEFSIVNAEGEVLASNPGSLNGLGQLPGISLHQGYDITVVGDKIAVAFTTTNGGAPRQTYMQFFDGTTAEKVGNRISVSHGESSKFGVALGVEVETLSNGNVVIAWADAGSQSTDTDGGSVWFKIYDASGNIVVDSTIVNENTAGTQDKPRLVATESGFIVGFHAFEFSPAFKNEGRFQEFDNDGARLGTVEAGLSTNGQFLRTDNNTALLIDFQVREFELEGADTTLDVARPVTPVNKTGTDAAEELVGTSASDTLNGAGGNDTLRGLDGADTLIGGAGDDFIFGGSTADDIRDVIYGGDGNDSIDGGYGNDELRGDAGDDSIEGGYGVDTVIGGDGNDVLTGSAWSDQIFGGNGNDFINGGFGFDRVNGGLGADKFYHTNAAGHGSDWIQDYNAAEGDVLFFGGGAATKADFLVQRATTANAGDAGVQEVFITHLPSGNLLWALVDGDGQSSLNVLAAGQTFDLLA
ncbi:calcium-binding protein [Pseudoprimorskyibacter insulae]|uniref:Leukotoxin n=1 Tax=Pseudoprimorskyibacter insulae TaxID=1695997 RepID=A0A2R8AQ47_9RHOB|nr:calcium-binding protein [Pseudoprimorskyibacter insulae]SPF78208.1 Leukotoxin [Pseudoprimorskyibacter insulae]